MFDRMLINNINSNNQETDVKQARRRARRQQSNKEILQIMLIT